MPANSLFRNEMARQPHILFVDDDPLVLNALKRNLRGREKDWDMRFFTAPQHALDAFKQHDFDVVVTDLAMPGMTGIDLICAMRPHNPDCSFIILTGAADLNNAVTAINQAHVFRFFTKPCSTEILCEGISSAIAMKKIKVEGADAHKTETRPSTLLTGIGLAALNRVAFGVIVTDHRSHVILSNSRGAEILAERDGLNMSADSILRAGSTTSTKRLHEMIQEMASATKQDSASIGFPLERSSPRRPFNVLVCPAPDELKDAHTALAILFVSDPERQALPSAESIAKIFGLTTSESKLVRSLTEGARLEEAAVQCGLTLSSARTYLKQAFAKTGTGRQSELIKLVLTAPTVNA